MKQEVEDMFYPLSEYYRDYDIPMPQFESVEAADLPEPYRHLLVHNADMTGRLTDFHDENLALRVLEKDALRGMLVRRVILYGARSGKEVEFGEILIYLNRFESTVRALIEEGKLPLGGILVDHQVKFISSPSHYLKVVADEMIAECLVTSLGKHLYGRKNKLTNFAGEILAEIVEILPPSDVDSCKEGGKT